MSLAELGDDLLCSILEGLGSLEDLVHMARVSRRFHTLVNSACGDGAWRQLYAATFGQPSSDGSSSSSSSKVAAAAVGTTFAAVAGAPQPPGSQQHPVAAPAWEPPPLDGARKKPRPTAAEALAPSVLPLPPAATHSQREGQSQGPSNDGGDSSRGGGSAAEGRGWKDRFRERFTEERRRLRLKQQARVMKLESSVQLLSQEVHRLQRALREEVGRLETARQEVAAVQAERRARAVRSISQQYWLPAAVQRAQGVVTAQTPVDLEGRETEALQRVAVCELEVRKLRNQATRRAERLDEERRRLQALQP